MAQLICQKDLHKITHVLSTFANLTQIRIFFFGFNGILITDKFVYLNPDSVKAELSHHDFLSPTVLPVCVNNQLWGAIICEATTISSKRMTIFRSYLKSALNDILDFHNSVTIWDPLSSSQLVQIKNLQSFFSSSSEDKMKTPTPSADDSSASLTTVFSSANSNLQVAINYIHQNIQKSLSLNEVAQKISLSPSYLSRLFKKNLHVNFVEYVNSQKIALAQEKLALTQLTIHEISEQLNFSQTSYFTKLFKRQTGLTPSEFRHHHHTAQKIYTIPRQPEHYPNESVLSVSQAYFQNRHIDYLTDSNHGSPYINRIADLSATDDLHGWVYLVDGHFPLQPADQIAMSDKSVVQWVYTAGSKNR